jgi:apolipoprotein N-acyltransferase
MTALALAPERPWAATGRLGLVLALASGAAAALAHPPFGALPGLLGYAVLLHVVDRSASLKSAFARGWAAGLAYFLISTWWVAEAFLVDAVAHGWQAPFAVAALAGGLALFWGAAGLAYRALNPKGGMRILAFAAIWGLAEWGRGNLLTGFPWDPPGASWVAGSPISQAASVVGVYGLSLITLAVAAAPAVLLGRADGLKTKLIAPGLAVLAFGGLWAFGSARLAEPAPKPPGLRIRVVQPDIEQAMKWSLPEFQRIVARYLALTSEPATPRPDVVIWPESALPAAAGDLLSQESWTRGAIVGSLSQGQTLLMGAYRTEGPSDGPIYFNSLVALKRTPEGFKLTGLYDKHHLVPFGEYLPMEPLMTRLGLKKIAGVGDGFTAGKKPGPMSPEGLPRFLPLICYESLFPNYTLSRGGERASWIVNISNDAWFGKTSGPPQHLNLASYRAIEAGLPMVRATPTGVSAVVDANGRTLASLGLGRTGVIDAWLPGARAETVYARWGDLSFWLMTVPCVFISFRRGKRP